MSEVVVDQFGNVKIPGVILARLGLGPGQRLIVETDEEGSIRLSPVSEEDDSVKFPTLEPELIELELIEENGILVLQAGANLDINKLIEEDREERMNKLIEGIQF
jgi:bifunctional DNA-binding transcriptional regulator/antitoxin component of YhaV-PrlF toxin-antitoxin module